ncbi:MAG: glycosyltransferase family 39 protein [Ignavibacteriales bacterium]|nr:glycosyltransferase family 39 protein [Ignavibacteriales bacterium]
MSNLLQRYPRFACLPAGRLLIILAIGLMLRLSVIAFHQRPLISDEKEYDQLALNLSTKGTYSYDSAPTAYRPVGYPAFVGAIYYIIGHHPVAVKILQTFLDVLTALLLFHLLSEFSERTRVIGAALWALYPPAILYTNFLMSETLFVFLLVVSVVILKSLDSRPSLFIFFLGALLGILALIKPNFIVFLVAVVDEKLYDLRQFQF